MAQDLNFAGGFELKGLAPVLARLKNFPEEFQKKALRSAMRSGANLVRKAAIVNAKKIDSEKTPDQRIFANIVVQFAARSSKRGKILMMRVGVLGGSKQYGNTKDNVRAGRVGKSYKTGGDKGNPGGDTWYWRFVEFGVPSRGIAPRAFMLPALERNAQAATDVITKSLNRAIDRMVAKYKVAA